MCDSVSNLCVLDSGTRQKPEKDAEHHSSNSEPKKIGVEAASSKECELILCDKNANAIAQHKMPTHYALLNDQMQKTRLAYE